MQWLVNPIGDLLQWSFGFLEPLKNAPNILFIIVGFAMFGYWMNFQNNANKKAENNPDQLK